MVVLPDPVAPTKAAVCRASTWKETPLSTHSPGS